MTDRYTELQRTRVIQHDGPAPRPGREASIGYTQPIQKSGGLLDDISLPQIIAGAAAAATSMVLASKIGIAGSVIGAAASSVITVVSSQLYRKFLDASARKIREGRDALGSLSEPGPETTIDMGARSGGAQQAGAASGPVRRARVAPAKLQARAQAERAMTQRKVVAFSAGIAVVAVIICTVAILLGTAGEGLGIKTEPLFAPTTERQADTSEEASSNQPANTDAPSSSTDSSNATGNDGADDPGATGTEAGESAGAGESTSDSRPSGGNASTDNSTGNASGEDSDTASGDTGSSTGDGSTGSTDTAGGTGTSTGTQPEAPESDSTSNSATLSSQGAAATSR